MAWSRLILSVVFSTLVVSGFTQWSPPSLEVNAARGFLWPHRQNMKHLPHGPAHFGELRYAKQGDGSEPWHQLYPNAEVGLSIKAFDLSNADILGYGFGTAFYFSAPVIHRDRFDWNLEIGAGPGIVTRPFDAEDNYKNIAIGSYGNAFIFLGQRFRYRISDSWSSQLNMSFNHFSNAAFSLPNLGLNYPMISLGATYHFKQQSEDTIEIADLPEKIGRFWTFGGSTGLKEYSRPYRSKAPVFVGLVDHNFGIGRKTSISIGADVMYDVALLQNRNFLGQEISAIENTQIGLRGGYNLHVEEMMIFLQIGAYILNTNNRDPWMYNRVGLRYFFTDHFGANLTLKTHMFKADYAEFGVAFRY